MSIEYKVDLSRWGTLQCDGATGIYVRAQTPDGRWVSVDIAELDKPSLNAFLKSRGGDNPWAESVARVALGWTAAEDTIP